MTIPARANARVMCSKQCVGGTSSVRRWSSAEISVTPSGRDSGAGGPERAAAAREREREGRHRRAGNVRGEGSAVCGAEMQRESSDVHDALGKRRVDAGGVRARPRFSGACNDDTRGEGLGPGRVREDDVVAAFRAARDRLDQRVAIKANNIREEAGVEAETGRAAERVVDLLKVPERPGAGGFNLIRPRRYTLD